MQERSSFEDDNQSLVSQAAQGFYLLHGDLSQKVKETPGASGLPTFDKEDLMEYFEDLVSLMSTRDASLNGRNRAFLVGEIVKQ